MTNKSVKVYCAGPFAFQYKDYSIENLAEDYRAKLVGDVNKIAHEPKSYELIKPAFKENPLIEYAGPFYFYEDQLSAEDVVRNERKMVRNCDVVFFFLPNDAACPGTITELVHAACAGKETVITYVKQDDKDTPENEWKSPLWYPLVFADIQNSIKTTIKQVANVDEAIQVFNNYLKQISPEDYDNEY